MPRLKEKIYAPFFVNRSSNWTRHSNGSTRFLFLVFWSLLTQCYGSQGYSSIHFCYDTNNYEGKRLNTTVHKHLTALSEFDCGVHCFEDSCCRSANFRKIPPHDGRENCELLHAVEQEEPEKLQENGTYDHLIMIHPQRPLDCKCFQCKNGEHCVASSSTCSCPQPFYGKSCPTRVKSCADLYKMGIKEDGVYSINPDGGKSIEVRCDMTTDGGGWTVFQRRQNGSVDFYRNWDDYKKGFGSMSGEFWLGLENIHRLTKTKAGKSELRVDLEDFEGEKRYAKYDTFEVKGGKEKYELTVGGYSGDAGDSLGYHNHMKFSTVDEDNDRWGNTHCAEHYKSAWWYNRCYSSSLNGRYSQTSQVAYGHGIQWYEWKRNAKYSLKKSEMKTRPRAS